MRRILVAALSSLGLAACGETVIEPRQFACQPPQLTDLSKKFVSELCVQNDIMADLNLTGPGLERAAYANYNQQQNASAADRNAMTCRLMDGKTWCAFNSYWVSAYRPPKGGPIGWGGFGEGCGGCVAPQTASSPPPAASP